MKLIAERQLIQLINFTTEDFKWKGDNMFRKTCAVLNIISAENILIMRKMWIVTSRQSLFPFKTFTSLHFFIQHEWWRYQRSKRSLGKDHNPVLRSETSERRSIVVWKVQIMKPLKSQRMKRGASLTVGPLVKEQRLPLPCHHWGAFSKAFNTQLFQRQIHLTAGWFPGISMKKCGG